MKKNILILGGGKSLEHEVSLVSAKNILQNICKKKYTTYFVGVTKNGNWVYGDNPILENGVSQASLNPQLKKIFLEEFIQNKKIEVVFPVLHGTYGEDGCIQGFFETLGIAYVGSDIRASAICMDKTLMKIILEKEKVLTAKYLVFFLAQATPQFSIIKQVLKTTEIVLKAASQGSSVGVYICSNQQELATAWQKLQKIDSKVLIEEKIVGREIEIALLGNEQAAASLAGEIILGKYDFYSYRAKYLDKQGVKLLVPAKLSKTTLQKMQKIAIQVYQKIQCSSMARIDFFLTKDQIYLNEINTIPGFTKISMYPKLWQATKIEYSSLIDKLIELALTKN